MYYKYLYKNSIDKNWVVYSFRFFMQNIKNNSSIVVFCIPFWIKKLKSHNFTYRLLRKLPPDQMIDNGRIIRKLFSFTFLQHFKSFDPARARVRLAFHWSSLLLGFWVGRFLVFTNRCYLLIALLRKCAQPHYRSYNTLKLRFII